MGRRGDVLRLSYPQRGTCADDLDAEIQDEEAYASDDEARRDGTARECRAGADRGHSDAERGPELRACARSAVVGEQGLEGDLDEPATVRGRAGSVSTTATMTLTAAPRSSTHSATGAAGHTRRTPAPIVIATARATLTAGPAASVHAADRSDGNGPAGTIAAPSKPRRYSLTRPPVRVSTTPWVGS